MSVPSLFFGSIYVRAVGYRRQRTKREGSFPFGKLPSARRKLLRHGAMLVPFGKSVSSLADSYNQSKYKYKNPYACNRKYNQIG